MRPGYLLRAAVVVSALLAAPLAQAQGGREEMRATLRLDMLRQINADRVALGLAPVQLDAKASAIADRYCEQQIRNGTTGHFTTDGLTPYMRYSLAGGNHGLSENAASWSANYNFTDRMIPEIVRRSQEAMMSETPPDDGHRRTILDSHATHVGIGFAWQGGEFRLAQEFVRKYIRWIEVPSRTATSGERLTGRGVPAAGHVVDAISVYFEPSPAPLRAAKASSIENYSFPPVRHDFRPREPATSERAPASLAEVARRSRPTLLRVARDGSFSFAAPAEDGPGIYTVVVWLRPVPGGEPIAASNISIRVLPVGGSAQTVRGAR